MGPYNEFAILDCPDKNHEYQFTQIKNYKCVKISDDFVNKWATELVGMNTFCQTLNKAEKGISRYGVTLIPPKSLDKLAEVAKLDDDNQEVKVLLNMIEVAKEEDKFVIHFGI